LRFYLLSTTLQFHGDESPGYCTQFSQKIIKSFSVKGEVPRGISDYRVDAYLLDAFCEKKRGGTGKTFNWEIARKVKKLNFPLILSGGLTPDNVKEAIRKVKPCPGKKSKEKLREFIQKVKEKG